MIDHFGKLKEDIKLPYFGKPSYFSLAKKAKNANIISDDFTIVENYGEIFNLPEALTAYTAQVFKLYG